MLLCEYVCLFWCVYVQPVFTMLVYVATSSYYVIECNSCAKLCRERSWCIFILFTEQWGHVKNNNCMAKKWVRFGLTVMGVFMDVMFSYKNVFI